MSSNFKSQNKQSLKTKKKKKTKTPSKEDIEYYFETRKSRSKSSLDQH